MRSPTSSPRRPRLSSLVQAHPLDHRRGRRDHRGRGSAWRPARSRGWNGTGDDAGPSSGSSARSSSSDCSSGAAWGTWTYAIPHTAVIPASKARPSIAARDRLTALGFQVVLANGRYDMQVPKVTSGREARGRGQRDQGTQVTIVPSKGPPPVAVPSVTGEALKRPHGHLKEPAWRGRGEAPLRRPGPARSRDLAPPRERPDPRGLDRLARGERRTEARADPRRPWDGAGQGREDAQLREDSRS